MSDNYVKIEKNIFQIQIIDKIKDKRRKSFIKDSYRLDDNFFILKNDLGENIEKIESILKLIGFLSFNSLEEIAKEFRKIDKKYIILFAHNGVGKTRLSMEFKNIGKDEYSRDTLYFNAFTEDLFIWDNDLDNDRNRVLELNKNSRFFDGLDGLDIDNKIRPFLQRYVDFDFNIETVVKKIKINDDEIEKEIQQVNFFRETNETIKVSRGEENIFIWCFFLAIAQLAIDEHEAYSWVKYIYIDDPISSLDDNNVITVASHLAQILKKQDRVKVIISTHHGLFYNIIFNELQSAEKILLLKNQNRYKLETLKNDTPFYQHIGILKELKKVADSGKLYTYHFNLLRNILEKTASFHGFSNFSECIKKEDDDIDEIIHTRRINILSHGNYSIFEPQEMQEDNKEHFRVILYSFIEKYGFNEELFESI